MSIEKRHYLIKEETLQEIAQAVRNKTNETGEIVVSELADKINNIEDGGELDTSDATAAAADIFAGKTAYVDGEKITGTFIIDDELTEQNDLISQISTLVVTKANPPSIDTSDATATTGDILSGKTAYVDGEKITGTIPSKTAATYTPTTSNQTIVSGTYLTGAQTIKGDANLKAENIAEGVSIFGITGTHSGGGSGGGGSVEMCTGTLVIDAPTPDDFTVYAVNENLQVTTTVFGMMSGGTFQAAKGTVVAITPWSTLSLVSGGCTKCFGMMGGGAFVVSDDFTLTYGG